MRCLRVPEGRVVHLVEGRQEHDVFKTHYAANTEKRIRELAQSNSFEVVELHLLTTDAIFAVFPPLAVSEIAVDSFADVRSAPSVQDEYYCRSEKGQLGLCH